MLASLKRLLVGFGVGAALGFMLWSLIGQGTTSLMFGSLGGTVTCEADVKAALAQFVRMQLYFALSGGVLAAIVGAVARSWWRKRKASREAATGAAPPQS